MTEPFLVPIPDAFLKQPQVGEWATRLHLWLDNISRPDGVLATSEGTSVTVGTQEEQIAALQASVTALQTSLNDLKSASPDYSISNDGTDRTLNADAAAGAITTPVVDPTEVENIRDAVLELADVVATLIRDLIAKGVLS